MVNITRNLLQSDGYIPQWSPVPPSLARHAAMPSLWLSSHAGEYDDHRRGFRRKGAPICLDWTLLKNVPSPC